MNHYTYRLRTTSQCGTELYYIGVRSSVCPPEQDINYQGSSRLVDYMRSQSIIFQKEIIDTYESRQVAEQAEQHCFDTLGCTSDISCINLHSHQDPYYPGRGGEKMAYYKTLFPQLAPGFFVDPRRQLTRNDLKYRVNAQGLSWLFLEHPENIKYYWHTTGTLSYWPGRADNLMTNNNGVKKYYLTRPDLVDGTAGERIQELINNHLVAGQRTVILEYIERLMSLTQTDERPVLLESLKHTIPPDQQWIIRRIEKNINNTQRY